MITLLKPFYTLNQLSEMMGIDVDTIRSKIQSLELTPDLMIGKILHFSEISKNKIIGFYEFEKTFSEIIYEQKNKPKEKFEVFESSMNK
jgi:hypothetical protein